MAKPTSVSDFISTEKNVNYNKIANGFVVDISGQVEDTRYGGLTYESIQLFVPTFEELVEILTGIDELPSEDEVDPEDYE